MVRPTQHDADLHLGVDHPVGEAAGRTLHDVVGGRVDAHRQRGAGVGEQVDPQDLGGQQRHGHVLARAVSPMSPAPITPKNIVSTSPAFDDSRYRRKERMLAKIAAPLADRDHDRGEVVVGQDHVGRFLADVGPGHAHGDADVGRPEGGGVVHPVARHGHDVAVGLQGVDEAQLVLGRHAGVHGRRARQVPQALVVEALEVGPERARGSPRAPDAEVGGDAGGGARVVARDHHGPDPRVVRLADRHAGLVAGRVDDADDAEVDELALELLERGVRLGACGRGRLDVGERSVGDRQRAQRPVGEAVHLGGDGGAPPVGERADLAGHPLVRAADQQRVGRPLGHDVDAPLALDIGLERGHEPALGGEGHLAHPLEPGPPGVGDAELRLGHQERPLGGVALHRPDAVLLVQHGVVGQAATARARTGPRRRARRRPRGRVGARRPGPRPRVGSPYR